MEGRSRRCAWATRLISGRNAGRETRRFDRDRASSWPASGARHRGWAVGAPSLWGTAWAWSSTPIPSTPTMNGGDGLSCDLTDRGPAPSAPHRRHWAMRSPARRPCALLDQSHGGGVLGRYIHGTAVVTKRIQPMNISIFCKGEFNPCVGVANAGRRDRARRPLRGGTRLPRPSRRCGTASRPRPRWCPARPSSRS